MPRAYERMRDKFLQEGLSSKEAKRKAARIYNSKHPERPVGPHSDKKRRKRGVSPKELFSRDG